MRKNKNEQEMSEKIKSKDNQIHSLKKHINTLETTVHLLKN